MRHSANGFGIWKYCRTREPAAYTIAWRSAISTKYRNPTGIILVGNLHWMPEQWRGGTIPLHFTIVNTLDSGRRRLFFSVTRFSEEKWSPYALILIHNIHQKSFPHYYENPILFTTFATTQWWSRFWIISSLHWIQNLQSGCMVQG